MPILLPPSHAIQAMRYAVMYQWDVHEEHIWARIIFFEGRFNCYEAQEFLFVDLE